MLTLFKKYLFSKHVFVSIAKAKEENPFETLFSLANLFNIRITEGEKLVQHGMIKLASEELGVNVPAPFYQGFPASVRELSEDQLLFDQLVHYAITYGFGNFSEAGHSLFEGQFERVAFKENTEIKDFKIVTEQDAVALLAEYAENLLSSTRPLSTSQFMLVSEYIKEYSYKPEKIASKNTAMKLLLSLNDYRFADYLSLSDVIKLTDELNFTRYKNNKLNKLNLKNADRKLLTAIIDRLMKEGRCDLRTCYEKKKEWCGLLHHIHYRPKNEPGRSFVNAMRGKGNESVFSDFERAMTERDIKAAVTALKEGKGSAIILRKLNYIISRCKTDEELEFVLENIGSSNKIVLLQQFIQYSKLAKKGEYKGSRTFMFTKHNLLKAHTETSVELNKRKSHITTEQAAFLRDRIKANLETLLSGKLGKVYVDPAMDNYALPLSESTSQGGFGVLSKGTRLKIEGLKENLQNNETRLGEDKNVACDKTQGEDKSVVCDRTQGEDKSLAFDKTKSGGMEQNRKKIRAFTYWEKVNDIDLSVIGLDKDGRQTEFSWRTMARNQSKAITFSGDETSGYNGGSEFFDIDTDEFKKLFPKIHFLVFCNNVFSGINFAQCVCRAGYMLRDVEDSGEIYEPKTVQTSFTINAESTFAYLFAIDLRTDEFIWLNLARSSSARVAGNTAMDFLTDLFDVTDTISVGSFFRLMASELVDDPALAEVIVTNKETEVPEGAELIREYDFEKMLRYMN